MISKVTATLEVFKSGFQQQQFFVELQKSEKSVIATIKKMKLVTYLIIFTLN